MNNNLKLRELGFKKVSIHKPSRSTYGPAMVLDNVIISYGIDTKTGANIRYESEKIHNKADSFWVLEYDSKYTIWISIIRNRISIIYLEDKEVKLNNYNYYTLRPDLSVLYDCDASLLNYNTVPKIESVKQIIDLLPLSIKRDFILNRLFK